eukprot:2564741-Rhodomonas_salina.1
MTVHTNRTAGTGIVVLSQVPRVPGTPVPGTFFHGSRYSHDNQGTRGTREPGNAYPGYWVLVLGTGCRNTNVTCVEGDDSGRT